MIDVLYFAWVRERIGIPREAVETTAITPADLVAELRQRAPRYAAAFADTSALKVAVDQELVDWDTPLGDAREVAFFPPMTGASVDIRVQQGAFDLGAETNDFATGHTAMGAIVTFTGVVRDTPDNTLDRMEIEHYPGMTEKAMATIAEQAMRRWSLGDVLVIHRHGTLRPGEMIMMVATAAPHRKDAFEAAQFLMDYLKSRAPFWKKEFTRDGAEWVAARAEDEAELDRWQS